MCRWRKVSDIITYYGKGVTPKYVDKSSIIVLNQKCIRHNKIDYSFAQYIDDSIKYNEDKYLKVGDVLINSTGQGTAGRVAIIEFIPEGKRLIIDSHVLVLRTKNYYESKCLNYSLFSVENILQTYIDGSTGQGEFDRVRLFNIYVNYPEDEVTQSQIATVLSLLDDKIELNNRINAELEQMAKILYDYWFVQFDFPNQEDRPYKSSGGEMEYNEMLKREIPKGWEVGVFNEWIKETKAGDWGKEAEEGNYTERVFCVRGADINGLNGKGDVKAPERFILKNNLSKALQPGDFIIEISGGSPTQSTARITLLTEKAFERFDTNVICSNFCKAVSIKDEKYVFNFRQEWQRLYDSGVFFGYEGKTSGIKNFLFDSFMNSYNVLYPKKEIVEKYFNFSKSLEDKKQFNLRQNQQLSSLRDWLLPMLMNGQVTVQKTYSGTQTELPKFEMAAEPVAEYERS
ncbi:restriction endonuclease subunit S [Dyadobacter sediminis]|uniref:restriction endonuclease subunit S n=1 Tax=Dyadobacter sediminis TaxID=1493691 RepID=UPI00166A67E2|nr:restriction endonuclease subunit S [Dyadobacter sediminis]GGB87712.1 type I restriction endonuclease subunit S [Dyadobacter sediminis]